MQKSLWQQSNSYQSSDINLTYDEKVAQATAKKEAQLTDKKPDKSRPSFQLRTHEMSYLNQFSFPRKESPVVVKQSEPVPLSGSDSFETAKEHSASELTFGEKPLPQIGRSSKSLVVPVQRRWFKVQSLCPTTNPF